MPVPLRIVTISRLFGAGGRGRPAALGARRGGGVLARGPVRGVAPGPRRPEPDVAAVDEQVLEPWQRAAVFASAAFPEMPVPPLEFYLDLAVIEAVEAVLRDAAAAGPCVVVGHGAQCIFHDREDALHLRLVAPFEQRVGVAMRRLGLAAEAARRHVRKADEERRAYLRQVHGVDGADAMLYDLVVNTRNLRVEEVADLVVRLVEGRD